MLRLCSSFKQTTSKNVIFFGTDSFAATNLEACFQHENVKIQATVIGKRAPKLSKVQEFSQFYDIPCYRWPGNKKENLELAKNELNLVPNVSKLDPNFSEASIKSKTDFAVVASFGHKVPNFIIKNCNFGGINVHGSFLPDFRGATPLQHAILTHQKFTGITLQTLDPNKIDYGDILLKSNKIWLNRDTTFTELHKTAAAKGANLLHQFFQNPEFYLENKYQQESLFSTTTYAKILNAKLEKVVKFNSKVENLYFELWSKFRVYDELVVNFHHESGKIWKSVLQEIELVDIKCLGGVRNLKKK